MKGSRTFRWDTTNEGEEPSGVSDQRRRWNGHFERSVTGRTRCLSVRGPGQRVGDVGDWSDRRPVVEQQSDVRTGERRSPDEEGGVTGK